MGVFIKDMKIPKGCVYCPFVERISRGRTVCLITSRLLSERFEAPPDKRIEQCTLAEVPEKHGRLIDADAFSNFLTNIIKEDEYEKMKIDEFTTVAEVLDAVVADLTGTGFDGFKHSPTIIESTGDNK